MSDAAQATEPEVSRPGGVNPPEVQELPSLDKAAMALHEQASPPAEEPAAPAEPAALEPEPVAEPPGPDLESALAKEREKLEARMQELEWREKQVSQGLELQQLAQQNPYEAWKKLNIPFKDLAQQVANEGRPDPVQQTQQQVEQLSSTIQELQSKLQLQESLAKTRDVMAKSEEYKLLQALGREEAVAQYALQNGGDHEAAVKEVLELVEGDLKRLEAAGLISRSRPTEQREKAPQPAAAKSVTLNNNLDTTPSREPKRGDDADEFQRLIQGIKGSFQ